MQPYLDIDARSLSPARFTDEIVAGCRPARLRGLCRDWPIVAAGQASPHAAAGFLAGISGDALAEVFVGPPGLDGRYHYRDDDLGEEGDGGDAGFTFARQPMQVRDALDRILAGIGKEDASRLYMGSLPADRYFPDFANTHGMGLLSNAAAPRLWIGGKSDIPAHFDTFDNLACVAAGRRRFTLYPPEAIADLYVGPIDRTMAGQPISLAAGTEPSDPRFPAFARWRTEEIVIDLDPGDALYLPKLWWHRVQATGPFNILVNYWWDGFAAGRDAPFATMLLAMIAICERPAAERAAWRSFFDHYVFRPNGHPLAHLPPSQHGVLGALRPLNYGRVRAWVMQLLRAG